MMVFATAELPRTASPSSAYLILHLILDLILEKKEYVF